MRYSRCWRWLRRPSGATELSAWRERRPAALVAGLLPALLGASAALSGAPGAEPVASGVADAIIADRRLPAPEPALDAAVVPALRRAVVAELVPRLGPVVGYKAALTSVAAQQRMGVPQPLLGSLLRDTLLPGPVLHISRPVLVEADLLVRVGAVSYTHLTLPTKRIV